MAQYPITKTEKAALSESQGNRCLICDRDFDPELRAMRPVVDHDHVSGEVRGVLCNRCNSALGLFLEDPEALCRAAEYATYHRSFRATRTGYDPMRLAVSWAILEAGERELARLEALVAATKS